MNLFELKIFEVAPTFFMVDIQKAAGDASEYHKVSTRRLTLSHSYGIELAIHIHGGQFLRHHRTTFYFDI